MGFFDAITKAITSQQDSSSKAPSDPHVRGFIESGRNKNDGGHDHRTNKGKDRTPSQRAGDKNRTKNNDD